ncbi:MAG: hypothetical protein ACKOWN_04945 [Microbacteriaceae bacterium]
MRHNFGNSPFPLIVRRPTSPNKKRVEFAPPTITAATAAIDETVAETETGGDK